jgi:serine/threonine protein kinase
VKPLSDAALSRLRSVVDRPEPGQRYAVHELLGRGGMGSVYRATDQVLARDVALKVLSTGQESGSVARRLQREARVLARLEHPGIVAVHDAGTLDDGRPFYVMRLVRGRRLDEQAREDGRGELLRRFLSICDAVSFAHARGVIHRDLKPSNVMVGEFGEVLVLDWGVAKVSDAVAEEPGVATGPAPGDTGDGVAVGTPGFMAPEQASGAEAVDARADVYGLGSMLRDLLAQRDEAIAAPLQAIVARATADDAAARYATVDALAADIRAWLDAAPVSAYRERVWERLARFYRRNAALILLLAAYVVVRLLILVWRGV